MTLTRIGKAFACNFIGGGIKATNASNRPNNYMSISGGFFDYLNTSADSEYIRKKTSTIMRIALGTGLLSNSNTNQVYSLENLYQFDLPSNTSSSISMTDYADDGKSIASLQVSNSTEVAITYTHYGIISGITSGQNTQNVVLLSYYEFSEPITIQPGETKTIQITVDVSNL